MGFVQIFQGISKVSRDLEATPRIGRNYKGFHMISRDFMSV